MQEQEYKEKENQEEDLEAEMKEFVKDMRDMRQRMNYATYQVQEQDKKLIGVNDKLDDYNKEVNKGDKYMDNVNKGVFGYFVDSVKNKFTGWFKKEKKLDKKDRNIIEEARNKKDENNNLEYHIDEKNDWSVIQKGEKDINKIEGEDAILDEALNEVTGARQAVRQFNSSVKESSKVVDATNNNMDFTNKNVEKVNKIMAKHK